MENINPFVPLFFFFIILAGILVAQKFKLPASFFTNQKKRRELQKKLEP
jgi:uncharacterized membrane protein (DUF106 family)